MERTQKGRCAVAVTAAVAAVLLSWGCGRTIEEEEPRELVESRIEPCRERCTAQLDPECGARPEDHPFRTVDECVEDCAAVEDNGWLWAPQEDGTDACAEEWIAFKDCLVALSCEDQHAFYRKNLVDGSDYPCKADNNAKDHCFYSAPRFEPEDDSR